MWKEEVSVEVRRARKLTGKRIKEGEAKGGQRFLLIISYAELTGIVVVKSRLFPDVLLLFQRFEFLEDLWIDKIGDVVAFPKLRNHVVFLFRVLR